jgi:hypothetical protein
MPFQGPATVEDLKQSIGFAGAAGLKAHAEVSITDRGEDKGALSGVFAYKAPGRMRLNLFGPFGLTISEVVISNGLFQLSVPSKKALYEWILPEAAFSGLPESRLRYEIESNGDLYLLVAYVPDGLKTEVAARYFFDKTYLLNRAICFYQNGKEMMRAELSEFNGRVPGRVRLTFSGGPALDIALQDPELMADIPDEYFSSIKHARMELKSFQEIIKDFAPLR